jgi:hypothetical protein
MAKAPKPAIPLMSKSNPEKRKSGHVAKKGSHPSPPSKRAKTSKNGKATSSSQHASPDPRAPVNSSRHPISTISSTVDDTWEQSFCIQEMNIITSSSIQKKVTHAVETAMGSTLPKSAVVKLHAKGPAASKMITVVEIAKRQIEQKGGKWFQYNKVEQVLAERQDKKDVKNKGNGKGKEKEGEGDPAELDGEEEEEDAEEREAFETMKTPFERANEGTAKVRAVLVMTIYLTCTRIEELRKAYG